MFISQSHFHQVLYHLGHASSEESFHQAVEKIQVAGQPLAKTLSLWIAENENQLNERDLPALLLLKQRLSTLLHLSAGDPFLYKIQGICHQMLGNPASENLLKIVKETFPGLDVDEQLYICNTLAKYPGNALKLLNLIREIPQEQRAFTFFENLNCLFNDFSDQNEQAILKAIGDVPSKERVSFIEMIVPLIQDIPNGNRRIEILQEIRMIPQAQRAFFVKMVTPLFKDISNGSERVHILRIIGRVPPEERVSLVEMTMPLIQDIPNVYARVSIFRTIGDILSEQRVSFIEMVAPLIQDIQEGRAEIIKTIGKILPEQRVSFIEMVVPLIQDTQEGRVEILKAIEEILPEQRAPFVGMLVPLIQDTLNKDERAEIIKTIGKIPPEQRVSLVEMTIPLFKYIQNGQERAYILEAIRAIPRDQRAPVIAVATPLFPNFSIYQQVFFLMVVPYFPPDSWDGLVHVLPALGDHSITELADLIQFVLKNNEPLREPMHAYLIGRLQSLTDRKETRRFAKFIWENQDKFLIYEEHPLAQEAVSKLILTERTSDPKNPYIIYQKLQEEAKNPFPILEWPAEEVAGQQVTFHLPAFQVNKLSQERVTFDQLPAISQQDLQVLFEAFEKRLEGLEDKRQETEDYIVNAFGNSFSFLKANFSDTSIYQLLSIKGKAGEIAPVEVAHFLKIVQFIIDQPNEIAAGELLSRREEVLLNMSTSIQNCKTGKEENIEKAYISLPPQYHYPVENKQIIKPEFEKGMAYLDALIVSLTPNLNDLLTSDNALLQELINTHPIEQLAHQSRYLKNLIGPKIGLQEQVKFDAHTSTLYNNLLGKATSEVLVIFYKHYLPFGPQKLVQTLVERVNQETDPAKKDIVFKSLNKFLGERNLNGIWKYDDEHEQYILIEAGAREIWMAAGYLKPFSSVNVNPSH